MITHIWEHTKSHWVAYFKCMSYTAPESYLNKDVCYKRPPTWEDEILVWKRRSSLLSLLALLHLPSSLCTRTFANKGPSSQGYGFSSSHVWMWELNYEESWAQKNWCFWTVVLEKTLESPLDCKEIQPVHPKGNQFWIFIGRTDAEAETTVSSQRSGFQEYALFTGITVDIVAAHSMQWAGPGLSTGSHVEGGSE